MLARVEALRCAFADMLGLDAAGRARAQSVLDAVCADPHGLEALLAAAGDPAAAACRPQTLCCLEAWMRRQLGRGQAFPALQRFLFDEASSAAEGAARQQITALWAVFGTHSGSDGFVFLAEAAAVWLAQAEGVAPRLTAQRLKSLGHALKTASRRRGGRARPEVFTDVAGLLASLEQLWGRAWAAALATHLSQPELLAVAVRAGKVAARFIALAGVEDIGGRWIFALVAHAAKLVHLPSAGDALPRVLAAVLRLLDELSEHCLLPAAERVGELLQLAVEVFVRCAPGTRLCRASASLLLRLMEHPRCAFPAEEDVLPLSLRARQLAHQRCHAAFNAIFGPECVAAVLTRAVSDGGAGLPVEAACEEEGLEGEDRSEEQLRAMLAVTLLRLFPVQLLSVLASAVTAPISDGFLRLIEALPRVCGAEALGSFPIAALLQRLSTQFAARPTALVRGLGICTAWASLLPPAGASPVGLLVAAGVESSRVRPRMLAMECLAALAKAGKPCSPELLDLALAGLPALLDGGRPPDQLWRLSLAFKALMGTQLSGWDAQRALRLLRLLCAQPAMDDEVALGVRADMVRQLLNCPETASAALEGQELPQFLQFLLGSSHVDAVAIAVRLMLAVLERIPAPPAPACLAQLCLELRAQLSPAFLAGASDELLEALPRLWEEVALLGARVPGLAALTELLAAEAERRMGVSRLGMEAGLASLLLTHCLLGSAGLAEAELAVAVGLAVRVFGRSAATERTATAHTRAQVALLVAQLLLTDVQAVLCLLAAWKAEASVLGGLAGTVGLLADAQQRRMCLEALSVLPASQRQTVGKSAEAVQPRNRRPGVHFSARKSSLLLQKLLAFADTPVQNA